MRFLARAPLAAAAATLVLAVGACQSAPAGGPAGAAGQARPGMVDGLTSTAAGGHKGVGGSAGHWSGRSDSSAPHGGGGYVRGSRVSAQVIRRGRAIQAAAHGGSAATISTRAAVSSRGASRATLLASSSTTGTIDPGGDDRLSTAKTGWATYVGVTASQVNSELTANTARPTEIRVVNPATPTFTVTMVADSGGYATSNWWWYYGLTASQVLPLAQSLSARPISLQRYQSGGQWLFAVVLVPNTGAAAQTWYWYYGDTAYLMQQASTNNARITRLHQYQVTSGDHFFDVLMTPDTGSTGTSWWGWWYGVSAYYVSQYESANHARLLDIEANSDGTFNIVLVASTGAWVSWWYGPDVSALVNMAIRDDLRVVANDEYTTSSGTTGYVILTIENNPDPASMRSDVLSQSLDVYQSQDGATNGMLQFTDSADGTTNLAYGSVPYNAETRVGSISKTFVATAILMLEAEGKLAITDSVDKWLPGVVPNGASITIEELLNHSGGINNYTDELAFTPSTMTQSFTPSQLVQIAVANPPYFAPGAGYHYSNTDYVLLAMIIEKVTGAYYGDFITSHIIDPLGLTGTSVPQDTSIPSPAMPGRWNDGSAVIDTTGQNASRWYGPGAVVSTVANLNTFYKALLSGQLLPAAQLSEMENDTVATGITGQVYGLGIVKTTLACGTTILWHNGYVMGYETFSAHSLTGNRNLTWAYDAPGGTDASLDNDLAFAAFCRF